MAALHNHSTRSGALSAAEKREIQAKIRSRSVPFLIGDEEEIIVRLTEEGSRIYKNTLFLRPSLRRVDERGHYHFFCTRLQARQYFLRFGAEAEILAPQGLREDFAQAFRAGAGMYGACPTLRPGT